VPGEAFGLLAAAPEDERVAAFEAHDTLSRMGQPDEQVVDFLLPQRMTAGLLTGKNAGRGRRDQFLNRRAHQAIEHDDVGILNQPRGLDRQQLGIARSRADEVHASLPHLRLPISARHLFLLEYADVLGSQRDIFGRVVHG
jgi:hypothetical protein